MLTTTFSSQILELDTVHGHVNIVKLSSGLRLLLPLHLLLMNDFLTGEQTIHSILLKYWHHSSQVLASFECYHNKAVNYKPEKSTTQDNHARRLTACSTCGKGLF